VYPPLAAYLEARSRELASLAADRQRRLDALAALIAAGHANGGQVSLLFVCTHNARRSQMAQVWAHAIAAHHALPWLRASSGGTEATALEPRAVAALERAGFRIERLDDGPNPEYRVCFAAGAPPVVCRSKRLDAPGHTTSHRIAVMTCAEADAGCPVVPGAMARVSLPFEDPRADDGTAAETASYDACCRAIARELLHVVRRVRDQA
jgi:hypothetical protein